MLLLSLPLSRSHDRRSFDCADERVTRFLREGALQDQERDLSRTTVFVEKAAPRGVVAYHTLLMSHVTQDLIPNDRPKIKRDLPVVLLGQMGVDVNFQGQGVGDSLLMDVQVRILRVARIIGVRALALDARSERLAKWYETHDFVRLPGSLKMFKSIEEVKKLIAGE